MLSTVNQNFIAEIRNTNNNHEVTIELLGWKKGKYV